MAFQRKTGRPESHDNVERWMVSYADFVTLLFCFFTAMYAISNIDSNKLGKFVDSMRLAFNASGERGNAISVIEGVQVILPDDVELEENVRSSLNSIDEESLKAISVSRDDRGVTISVSDKLFFESASAKLKNNATDTLDTIADVLKTMPNMIRIEGHTDNIPMHSARFPSNWELSASRAINVARYFIEKHGLDPMRLSTIGYAEFRPVASNDTPGGRARNRRVDIVILNEREAKKEAQ
jgi:chemotaxis protein MotB